MGIRARTVAQGEASVDAHVMAFHMTDSYIPASIMVALDGGWFKRVETTARTLPALLTMPAKHAKLILLNKKRRTLSMAAEEDANAQQTAHPAPETTSEERPSPEIDAQALFLIERAPDAALIVDAEGLCLYANQAFVHLLGYDDREELAGSPLSTLVHERDLERVGNRLRDAVSPKPVRPGEAEQGAYEFRGIVKGGGIIYLEGSDAPASFRGRPAALCFVRNITRRKEAEKTMRQFNAELEERLGEAFVRLDVTNRLLDREIADRKNAEAALKASEARYRAIVQDQSELVCRFLPDTTLTFVNDAFCRFFGGAQDGLVGLSFVPLLSKRTASEMTGLDPAGFMLMAPTWSAETLVRRHDGRKRWLQWTGRAILDHAGKPVEFQGVGRDITEAKAAEEQRKATEAALRESEEKFRVLAENAAAGIVIYRNNRLLYTNPAMSSITGYTRDELAKMTVLDAVYPDLREEARRWSRAVARGEKAPPKGGSKIATKSGEDRWVDVTMGNVVIDSRPASIGTLIDVTTRKTMEDALRQRVDDIGKLYEASRILLQHMEMEKLYGEICRIGVERFGLRMAWVGRLEEGIRVRPVAFYRNFNGSSSRDPFGDAAPITKGPVRRAVVSMLPSVTNAIRSDRHFAPWRKETLAAGYRSFAAFPLIYGEAPFGVVAGYAQEEESFTEDRLRLYQSFANLAANAVSNASLLSSISGQRDQLRAMSSRLSEAGEKEKRQLSQELHDRVGQNLTALSINLNILGSQHPKKGPESARFDDCLALLNDMTDSIRNVMSQLRPALLDEYGLLAALREHCARFSRRFGIEVEVQGDESGTGLAPHAETAMFRIAQEALNNVAKHAHAGKAAVKVTCDDRMVRMVISDDGDGFAMDAVTTSTRRGWGLTTMTERAEAVGGSCTVESMPGYGTLVTVEVLR